MKNVIKSIIFIMIFMILFYFVFNLLWLKKQPTAYFFEYPKNSLDVVYVGPSNVLTSFNPSLAYKEYGITVGNLSNTAQSVEFTKYLLMEASKYQKPKLYVLDIGQISLDLSEFKEGDNRQTIDAMPFSKARFMAIDEMLERQGLLDNNKVKLGYYFSFFKYHNRWKEVLLGSPHITDDYINGLLLTKETFKSKSYDSYIWSSVSGQLADENRAVLNELINYIKTNNLNVLFIIPPRLYEESKIAKLNDAIDIIESNNFNILNFNNLDDYKVDYSKDLFDESHINTDASTTYTRYFSSYLIDNYNLPTHFNEYKYEYYNQSYEKFKERYKKLTNREFIEKFND